MVTAYEAGEKAPSIDTLSRIATVLGFPVTFFAGEDMDASLLASASFRALRSMTSGERDAAYASGVLALHLAKWIDERFELPAPNVPSLHEFGNPEASTQALRTEWRLGERPVAQFLSLLESKGVRVFALPTDSRRVDAFSGWQAGTPFIFVNTSKTPERVRFDLAHELAHLTLHQHGKPSGRTAELEADRFAGAFLMPRGSVLAHGPRNPSLGVLDQHKRRWGVSAAALIHRLHEVGMASDWTYRGLCIELSKRGLSYEPNSIPPETSQMLTKVLNAMRSEGLGHAAIARDLNLAVDDLSALMMGLVIVPVAGTGRQPTGHEKPALRLVN